jgi:hypothetical protein
MIVKLPNGEKIRVNEADVGALEKKLKQVFVTQKEKSVDELVSLMCQVFVDQMDKNNKLILSSIVSGIKSIEFPKVQVNVPKVDPVVSVEVDGILRDWRGLITGLTLKVER